MELVMTSSLFLSIGYRFYLQYGKNRKTTYVIHFFAKVDAKDASSILTYYALVSTASGDFPTMKEFMAPKKA